MSLRLYLTDERMNTQHAPLAVLMWVYRCTGRLEPLKQFPIAMQSRKFSPADKLIQVLISMLAGCEYISEINTQLRPEKSLAQVWPWPGFAEQSGIQKTLDGLSLMELTHLQAAVTEIWRAVSHTVGHDWRSYLWLDVDLTGLPCGGQAEGGTKGYFSGKKTSGDGN